MLWPCSADVGLTLTRACSRGMASRQASRLALQVLYKACRSLSPRSFTMCCSSPPQDSRATPWLLQPCDKVSDLTCC